MKKLVTKKDGQDLWVAIKDTVTGLYECWFDPDTHKSTSIILAGHLYSKEEYKLIKRSFEAEQKRKKEKNPEPDYVTVFKR